MCFAPCLAAQKKGPGIFFITFSQFCDNAFLICYFFHLPICNKEHYGFYWSTVILDELSSDIQTKKTVEVASGLNIDDIFKVAHVTLKKTIFIIQASASARANVNCKNKLQIRAHLH